MRPGTGAVVLALMAALLAASGAGRAADIEKAAPLPGLHGVDRRQPVVGTAWPWRAIGRVNRAGHGFCTGVLVDERHVLTAAHCLWNPATRAPFEAASLHFVAGWSKGAFVAHAPVVRVVTADVPAYTPTQKTYRVTNDWAVLELDAPIGTSAGWVQPLSAREFDRDVRIGTALTVAGYNQDIAQSLRVDGACAVERLSSGGLSFEHACEATKGVSGGPLLVKVDGVYRVAGLLVGVEKGGLSIAVSIKALPPLPSAAYRE